jgi:glycerol-3-phosphate dehydrogenase
MVVKMLEQVGLELTDDPNFDPYRKPIITKKPLRPFNEIRHLVDIPSSPEKIICKCEQVTQGEIVDPFTRG